MILLLGRKALEFCLARRSGKRWFAWKGVSFRHTLERRLYDMIRSIIELRFNPSINSTGQEMMIV